MRTLESPAIHEHMHGADVLIGQRTCVVKLTHMMIQRSQALHCLWQSALRQGRFTTPLHLSCWPKCQ